MPSLTDLQKMTNLTLRSVYRKIFEYHKKNSAQCWYGVKVLCSSLAVNC